MRALLTIAVSFAVGLAAAAPATGHAAEPTSTLAPGMVNPGYEEAPKWRATTLPRQKPPILRYRSKRVDPP